MKCCAKWPLAMLVLVCATMPSPVWGQATRPSKGGPLGELAVAKGIFREHASDLEAEITERALSRTDATGVARVRVELELDLRLLSAWLCTAQGDDEVLANAYLRSRQLLEAGDLLEAELTDEKLAMLTGAQKEGLKRLHDLTFRLPDANSITSIDNACRTIGWGILQAGTPQAVGENSLPVMRPKNVPATPNLAPAEPARAAAKAEPRDPEKLLPRLNVSPRLRQQLLQLQSAMRTSESAGGGDTESLRKMLYEAIDLAAGFSANAAVESEERLGLEQQLTEALALYVDPRTRAISRSRMDALGQYRGLVTTITDLNLSPQSYQLLSPAFRYVQRNPGKSVEILGSVRQFVDMAVKYESLPREVPAPASMTRLPAVYQDARRSFENYRNLYLGVVEGLEGAGMMGSGPEGLPPALAEMRQSYDAVTSLTQFGSALETLNTFKPKPIGGLEKRLIQEALAACNGGASRVEATKFLVGVVQLAETARELPKLEFQSLPVETLAKQGVENVGELAAKARTTIATMVSDIAAGGTLDAEKLRRHHDLPKLLASLKAAAGTQDAFARVDTLARWADWDGDREVISLVLSPYLSALNFAVASYLSDTGDAIKELPQVEYATYPLRTLLVRDLLAAPELERLPGGLTGACGKLATPADQFGAERYTSFGIVVWARARAGGDLKSSETALKVTCKRIATDLSLRFDERRATFSMSAGAASTTTRTSDPARTGTTRPRRPQRGR